MNLCQMLLLHSTPLPFFLFLETCLGDAVKKHVTSGLLETVWYQWAATPHLLLPVFSATERKHLLRFCGHCFTDCKRISSSDAVHFLFVLIVKKLSYVMLYIKRIYYNCYNIKSPPCHHDKED